MTGHHHWRDAVAAAERLTAGDLRTLQLVAQLPLIWEGAIECLYGFRGGASVYRCLARLREMGLIVRVHQALRAGRNPGLLYLTDLGVATVAIVRQVDPVHVARRERLRGPDLRPLLPGLPHLHAAYQLLAAVTATQTGHVELLNWERPWRRRFRRPSHRAPITVAVPAGAVLSWDGEAAELLLVPDLATFPLRVHRPMLRQLQALGRIVGRTLPPLVIATTDARQSAWTRLLRDAARSRGGEPLTAHVVTWRDLLDGSDALKSVANPVRSASTLRIRHPRLRPLGHRQPGSPIPRPVGTPFQRASSNGGLGALALEISPLERSLLDVIGRHPFLPAVRLATVLGWEVRRVRERRARLIGLGLVRLLSIEERCRQPADDLTELTVDGLELVAAQQGLSLARAVRFNGLVGGGPESRTGTRKLLLRDPDHTLGADALFVDLIGSFKGTAGTNEGDALLEWRNAAACSRRRVRPDGYGMIRRTGQTFGFFLEYDRGKMSARDYYGKWRGYYDYRGSRAFERDYDGFPTILVVTTNKTAEERIARSVRAASIGRWAPLPLLLTCEWRMTRDPTNRDGLLGPVWRSPDDPVRRAWPGRD